MDSVKQFAPMNVVLNLFDQLPQLACYVSVTQIRFVQCKHTSLKTRSFSWKIMYLLYKLKVSISWISGD